MTTPTPLYVQLHLKRTKTIPLYKCGSKDEPPNRFADYVFPLLADDRDVEVIA